MADQLQADVVIVGAGVAGMLAAWSLASAGAKVLVLESGPTVDRAESVKIYRDALAKIPESPYPDVPYAPRPTVIDLKSYLIQVGPDLFKSSYTRRVGGTTWHWLGTAMRHLPNDFKLKTLYGVGADWPITYDQLEPWYGDAEKQLGVAGDDSVDLGSPRSQKYPLPPIKPTYCDQVVGAAATQAGYQVRSTPQARNSQEYQGRPACCGNAICVPICPIGAKYDATVHVKLAQDKGAQVMDQSVAYKIDVASDGKISAVHFKRPDNSEHTAVGKVYIVAAHAIETPKLLLISRTDAVPNGVANSSDQVGRNLMDHVTQISLALTKDPIFPFRSPLETSGIENDRDGDFRKTRAAYRTPIGNDGWSFGGTIPIDTAAEMIQQGKLGKDLRDALQQQAIRELRFAGLVEQLPDPKNQVSVAWDQKDALGIPKPKIAYSVDDYTKQGAAAARQMADKVFDALAVTQRNHVSDFFGAGHIVGTYRMGSDPKTSVVDANQRSHDHSNLFLLGSGVFPTEGTANPTLTIAALALWAADTIKKDLGK